MNKSKKLQVKKEKKNRLMEPKSASLISLPWLIGSIVVVVALVAALLFDQLYKPTLMTIDGKKYTIRDLSYYFYNVESQYSYMDYLFFGGDGSYWDMAADNESGQTIRDASKTEAVNYALYCEVLYNEAVSEGYSLTDEENQTISENVSNLLNGQISPAAIRKNNFTKAYLTNLLGKTTLVNRYRQDKIDQLNIDVEEIKKDINYEDYRQYDIETISISKKTTDDNGTVVDLSEEEKQAAYDKIKAVYEQAKTSEDWSTLLPDDETELVYKSDDSFIKTDNRFSEEMKEKVMAMDNGDISDIIEEENAYYIVRMINNNSSESYDEAVQNAVEEAESEAFNKMYNDEILPKHQYTINDKALKKYKMGSITIANSYY